MQGKGLPSLLYLKSYFLLEVPFSCSLLPQSHMGSSQGLIGLSTLEECGI